MHRSGELSIFPTSLQILTPCLHMIPKTTYGLVDKETRFRQRYLDLILNRGTRDIFQTRAKVRTTTTTSPAHFSAPSLPPRLVRVYGTRGTGCCVARGGALSVAVFDATLTAGPLARR